MYLKKLATLISQKNLESCGNVNKSQKFKKIATHFRHFIYLSKMSELTSKNVTKEEVLALEASRKSKEEKLSAWMGVLDSQGVGMNDPLVDSEDYPSTNSRQYLSPSFPSQFHRRGNS